MDLYRQVFEFSPDGLLLVAQDGRITQANSRACSLFGYAQGELNSMIIEQLIPKRVMHQHAAHRQHYQEAPRVRSMGAGLALFGLRKDGSEFPADVMISPLRSSEGPVTLCVVRDISERKRAEQLVLAALKEKEVLLKEIHHRVKNNLAVIASLFSLQSNLLQDESMKAILRESQDRVRSMALVHETLYSHNLATVDFAEYVTSLSTQLIGSYSLTADQVRLETSLEPILLSIDMAVPCGLILNELITNALKHGMTPGQQGTLQIGLRHSGPGRIELEVRDDGRGLPADFTLSGGTSLGKRLIRSLTKQIDGTVEFAPASPGTRVVLSLPLPHKCTAKETE